MRGGWRGGGGGGLRRREREPKWKRVDKRGDKRASVEGARVLATLENSCVKRNSDEMDKGVESLKLEREKNKNKK